METETIIDEKGRICIPATLRKKLNLNAGEKIIMRIDEKQNLIIKALQGKNPEALYQLAALLQEGRLINLDNKIKREIFIKLEKYYYDLHQHSTLLGELREYFTKYPNLLS